MGHSQQFMASLPVGWKFQSFPNLSRNTETQISASLSSMINDSRHPRLETLVNFGILLLAANSFPLNSLCAMTYIKICCMSLFRILVSNSSLSQLLFDVCSGQ